MSRISSICGATSSGKTWSVRSLGVTGKRIGRRRATVQSARSTRGNMPIRIARSRIVGTFQVPTIIAASLSTRKGMIMSAKFQE